MLLIIDCGSTKADYILASGDGTTLRGETDGINASFATVDDLEALFRRIPHSSQSTEIRFYGAGCLPGDPSDRVAEAARRVASEAHITADSDMLGAAKALCGDRPGIACILGTGSNSCLYDGSGIVNNIPSLGFILGDEGSGNHLGRHLLSGYFKRRLPEQLSEAFRNSYPDLSIADVIENVYRKSGANAWLAGFAKFLSSNISIPGAEAIVTECFDEFVDHCLRPYGLITHEVPIGFVGSIAAAFAPQLRLTLAKAGMTAGAILAKPLDAFTYRRR